MNLMAQSGITILISSSTRPQPARRARSDEREDDDGGRCAGLHRCGGTDRTAVHGSRGPGGPCPVWLFGESGLFIRPDRARAPSASTVGARRVVPVEPVRPGMNNVTRVSA